MIGWVTDEGIGDTRGKLGEYPQNLQLKIQAGDKAQVAGGNVLTGRKNSRGREMGLKAGSEEKKSIAGIPSKKPASR